LTIQLCCQWHDHYHCILSLRYRGIVFSMALPWDCLLSTPISLCMFRQGHEVGVQQGRQGLVSSTRLQGPSFLNQSLVLGRVEAMIAPSHVYGHRPKLGHLSRALIMWCFYVQLSAEDMRMLIVSPTFQQGVREWIKIPLPAVWDYPPVASAASGCRSPTMLVMWSST
jgi:hypothetical protein